MVPLPVADETSREDKVPSDSVDYEEHNLAHSIPGKCNQVVISSYAVCGSSKPPRNRMPNSKVPTIHL